MKLTSLIVIGVLSLAAMVCATALIVTNHGSDAGIVLGFVTSILVSLIALVNSSQAKNLLNGTKELSQDNAKRLDKVEEKVQ